MRWSPRVTKASTCPFHWSYTNALNSPSNGIWQHRWNVTNDKTPGELWCSEFLLQVSRVWPMAWGIQTQEFTIDYMVSINYLIKLNNIGKAVRHTKTFLSGRISHGFRTHFLRAGLKPVLKTGISWKCSRFQELRIFICGCHKDYYD